MFQEMKNNIYIALAAAGLLAVQSCSDSGADSLKNATSGFDFNLVPATWEARGHRISAYVSSDGETILENDGMAPGSYGVARQLGLFHDGYAVAGFERSAVIINTEGEPVVDLSGFELRRLGLPAVSEGCFLANRADAGAFVCFDMEGTEVFEAEGNVRSQLRNGYALYSDSKYGDKLGVVNAAGDVVLEAGGEEYIPGSYSDYMSSPASYAHPTWFPLTDGRQTLCILDIATGKRYLEGMLDSSPLPAVDCNDRVVIRSDRKYGLMDLQGNTVVEPQYDYIRNDGEWYVFEQDGLYGWIDKNGGTVIEAQFKTNISPDMLGFAGGDLSLVDSKIFINRKGEPVLESEYTVKSNFVDGRCLVEMGGREGYAWMNRDGEIVSDSFHTTPLAVASIGRISMGQALQY